MAISLDDMSLSGRQVKYQRAYSLYQLMIIISLIIGFFF